MAVRKRTDLIVIHVTASPPSADIGVREVDAMHRAKGWKGCGYHYVIRRDGTIELGRPVDQIGAHVEGWNSVSVGVSLVGGVDQAGRPQDNRTNEQRASLQKLVAQLLAQYPKAKVCGHRDLSKDADHDGVIEPHEHIKACPCFDAIPWARQLGFPGAAIRGHWDEAAPAIETLGAPDGRIVWLQKLLLRAGYAFGPTDGHLGARTATAIGAFQRWEGLPVTNAFDAATTERLRVKFEEAAA